MAHSKVWGVLKDLGGSPLSKKTDFEHNHVGLGPPHPPFSQNFKVCKLSPMGGGMQGEPLWRVLGVAVVSVV